jgi:hypothetical protein
MDLPTPFKFCKEEWLLLSTFFALFQIHNFNIMLMAGDSGFEFRQGKERFFFSTTSTSAVGPNQRPINGTGVLSLAKIGRGLSRPLNSN